MGRGEDVLCAKPAVVVGGSLEEVSTSVIGVSENLSGLSPIHPRLAATGSSGQQGQLPALGGHGLQLSLSVKVGTV